MPVVERGTAHAIVTWRTQGGRDGGAAAAFSAKCVTGALATSRQGRSARLPSSARRGSCSRRGHRRDAPQPSDDGGTADASFRAIRRSGPPMPSRAASAKCDREPDPWTSFPHRPSMDRVLFAVFNHENCERGLSIPVLATQPFSRYLSSRVRPLVRRSRGACKESTWRIGAAAALLSDAYRRFPGISTATFRLAAGSHTPRIVLATRANRFWIPLIRCIYVNPSLRNLNC
jgi:hypothetical protein